MLLNPMRLGMRGDTSSGPRGKSLGSLGFLMVYWTRAGLMRIGLSCIFFLVLHMRLRKSLVGLVEAVCIVYSNCS